MPVYVIYLAERGEYGLHCGSPVRAGREIHSTFTGPDALHQACLLLAELNALEVTVHQDGSFSMPLSALEESAEIMAECGGYVNSRTPLVGS